MLGTPCTSCSNNTNCIKCTDYTFLDGAICTSCPNNCVHCTNASYCIQCQTNYYMNFTSGGCIMSYACYGYIPGIGCTDCGPGQYRINQTTCMSCGSRCAGCIISTTCLKCWGWDSSLGGNYVSCTACITNCSSCTFNSSICYSCTNGYFSSNKCNSCGTNCATCTNTGVCLGCFAGTFLNSIQKCQLCNLTLTNCLSCISSTICTSCKFGYYVSTYGSKDCLLCNQSLTNCAICASSTVCTACVSTTLFLNIGSCVFCKTAI